MIESTNDLLDFTRQFSVRLDEIVTILQKRMDAQAKQDGAKDVAAIAVSGSGKKSKSKSTGSR